MNPGRAAAQASVSPRPILPLQLGDRVIEVGSRTLVMGVLNCTPDSFSDGGAYAAPDAAVRRYHEIVAAGADWVDVGGESTRPGAQPVTAAEEWARVAPVLEAARRAGHPLPLSIDTTKHEVAARALDAGARIINDVSALRRTPALAELAARYGAALVLMHMQGTPDTMQRDPTYGDVVGEIAAELRAAMSAAQARGVRREQLVVDPGIGFGKTIAHNLEILRRLGELASLERPILIGCSRKSFLAAAAPELAPAERLEASLAAHAAGVLAGAHLVRVHDVRAHVRALRLIDAIRSGPAGS